MSLAFIRSWNSYSGGFLSPANAVKAAKKAGATSVAWADKGEMSSFFEFLNACKDEDINPIPGVEVLLDYNNEQRPIHIYAAGDNGVSALWNKVANAEYKDEMPVIKAEDLNGLVAVTGHYGGHFEDFLFKKDKNALNKFLNDLKNAGAKVAVGVNPDIEALYTPLIDDKSFAVIPFKIGVFEKGDVSKYRDVVKYAFKENLPDSFSYNLPEIETCESLSVNSLIPFNQKTWNGFAENFRLKTWTNPEPKPVLYKNLEDGGLDELKKRCFDKLDSMFSTWQTQQRKEVPQETIKKYKDRVNTEINTIEKAGFQGRIIIIADAVKHFADKNITITARGSAANSMVCYLLGISMANCVKHNLPYERFLNPHRISEPDIDLDVPFEHNDAVRDYFLENIPGAVGIRTFRGTTFLQCVDSALDGAGLTKGDIDKCHRLVKVALKKHCSEDDNISNILQNEKFQADFFAMHKDRVKLQTAANILLSIGNRPLGDSKHVGIAIAGTNVCEMVPVQKIAVKGKVFNAASIPYSELEKHGVFKFDVLTNTELDFNHVLNEILVEQGQKPISLKDSMAELSGKHISLLSTGKVSSIFQLEKQSKLLKLVQPDKFEDIVACNGAIRVEGDDTSPMVRYIKMREESRQAGKTIYKMPAVFRSVPSAALEDYKNITRDTYGVIIFQEQLTEALRSVSGLSRGHSESIRKAVSKGKVSDDDKNSFILAAHKHFAINQFDSEKLFETITQGGTYLFNRGHAFVYSMIIAAETFAKQEHTAEFMVAKIRQHALGMTAKSNIECKNAIASLAYETNTLGVKVSSLDFSRNIITKAGGDKIYGTNRFTHSNVELGIDSLSFAKIDEINKLKMLTKCPHPKSLRAEPYNISDSLLEQCINLDAFKSLGKSKVVLMTETFGSSATAPVETSAAYQECLGFLPSDIHPGFPKKDGFLDKPLIISQLRSTVKEPEGYGNVQRVTGFIHGKAVVIRGDIKNGKKTGQKYVKAEINVSSGAGDYPIKLTIFFGDDENKAQEFVNSVESHVNSFSNLPAIFEVKENKTLKYGSQWNLATGNISTPNQELLVPFESMIDIVKKKRIEI